MRFSFIVAQMSSIVSFAHSFAAPGHRSKNAEGHIPVRCARAVSRAWRRALFSAACLGGAMLVVAPGAALRAQQIDLAASGCPKAHCDLPNSGRVKQSLPEHSTVRP